MTAFDFVTIGLLVVLEGLLSADNALVIAVMVLGLPKPQHHKALSYGLVGAFALRVAATLLAVYLIHVAWVKLAGGAYLLYLSAAHFRGAPGDEGRRTAPAAKPFLGLSAFWSAVIRIELVNLAFSIDSILVAVAMSSKFWVVLAGGLLGIIAMRVVVGQVVKLLQRYPALVDAAFVIIAWVGCKLLADYLHQIAWIDWRIPQWVSIGAVVAIIGAGYLYARRSGPQPVTSALEEAAKEEADWPGDET